MADFFRVDGIDAGYGRVQILRGAGFALGQGQVVCLVGRNGAGKSTLLKAIMGLIPIMAGQITLEGKRLDGLPAHQVPRHRLGYVPQGRRLFADLSVAENLEIGLMAGSHPVGALERVISLFPVLGERLRQRAGTLSGGEQQMLAIGRALCLDPVILLMDEPTEGLQPSMVALIRDVVEQLSKTGVATILVEQRIDTVIDVADRVVFVENGTTPETVDAAQVAANPALTRQYVGLQA